MSRFALVAAALAPLTVALWLAAAGLPASGPQPLYAQSVDDRPVEVIEPAIVSFELALFQFANEERARRGLDPLRLDHELVDIARARAASQSSVESLSHLDLAGQTAFTRLMANDGFRPLIAAESLVWVSGSSRHLPAFAHDVLVDSPPHLALIFDPRFNHLAVGGASSSPGQVVFAQIFSGR